MFAAFAVDARPDDPLAALRIDDLAVPVPDFGVPSVRVHLRAAALNHHDLWSLQGVGLPRERLPMVLGCDGAGVTDDGDEVIVHSIISAGDYLGDEVYDPNRSILSERYPGTLAETVWVPSRNLVPKPTELDWRTAACLPVAYLTAYRMLFGAGAARPGQTVLIQGAGGGVATAATVLARAAGLRVWVTSRTEDRRRRALTIGADLAVPTGLRLPEPVDLVLETVGEATWSHSLRALRPGGTLVVAGATSGPNPPADLARVFFRPLTIKGTTMGTRAELADVVRFVSARNITPVIDSVYPWGQVAEAFSRLASGDMFGKVVVTME